MVHESLQELKDIKEKLQNFLTARGYENDGIDFGKMTIDEFEDYISSLVKRTDLHNWRFKDVKKNHVLLSSEASSRRLYLSEVYEKLDGGGDKLLVYFIPETNEDSTSVNFVSNAASLCILKDCISLVMFSSKKYTPTAVSSIKSINIGTNNPEGIYSVTAYCDNDFVDMTSISYGPNITKIFRGQEAKDFLKSCGDMNFAKIIEGKPISKFYGLKEGDIIEYQRPNIPGFLRPSTNYKIVKSENVQKRDAKTKKK